MRQNFQNQFIPTFSFLRIYIYIYKYILYNNNDTRHRYIEWRKKNRSTLIYIYARTYISIYRRYIRIRSINKQKIVETI